MPNAENDGVAHILARVRQSRPLVHNITNHVVMNLTANALLACGASPVMSHAREEVGAMASLASSLVINIGTLEPDWVEAMIIAGRTAGARGIPVVLDPVGAGATSYRTETTHRILGECRVTVLRGNASEVKASAGEISVTRGVDSSAAVADAREAALALSRSKNLVTAVTGPEDFVTDGERTFIVRNGHPVMGTVTGMGCTATALIAAFVAETSDAAYGTAAALSFFGVAGEKAAARTTGPGSFLVALLDTIASLEPEELEQMSRVERVA